MSSLDQLRNLDQSHRLTPWSLPEHARYVAEQYGARLATDPANAEGYVVGYEEAEKKFDESYQTQRDLLAQASTRAGDKPQELPDVEKIDWDPRKLFSAAPTPEEVKAAAKAPVKKRGAKKEA